VVYSVYHDDFPGSLNKNFRKKLLLKGIVAGDVKILEEPTYLNISKLALTFSDAVIQGSQTINPEIGKFAEETCKKFLPFQSKETYIDSYNTFYDEI
jgi:starch synthase